MGLGLPDGGHLTHGYYVSLTFGFSSHTRVAECSRIIDCQKENDRIFNLLPVPPVRHRG